MVSKLVQSEARQRLEDLGHRCQGDPQTAPDGSPGGWIRTLVLGNVSFPVNEFDSLLKAGCRVCLDRAPGGGASSCPGNTAGSWTEFKGKV